MATNTAYTEASRVNSTDAVKQRASGKITFPATAITATDSVVLTLGFTPKYFFWFNLDIVSKFEWWEGMTANTCIKTLGSNGVMTAETTNGGITVSGNTVSILQNATLLAISADDVCYWVAEA